MKVLLSATLLSSLWFAPCGYALDSATPRPREETGTLDDTLVQLRRTLRAQSVILDKQQRAWPTRQRDERNAGEDLQPPKRWLELETIQGKLWRRREALLERVRSHAATDVEPLLDALTASKSVDFVEATVSTAVELGRKSERLFTVLKELVRRFDPCPDSVLRGLADTRREDAGLFLLELGLREKSVAILRSAGNTGRAAVVGKLISVAQSKESAIADLGLRTLATLTPPELPSADLQRIVTLSIETANSAKLKAALIAYLGFFRTESNFSLLRTTYERAQADCVKVAVLGALGNLGPSAGEFVLGELRREGNSLAIRRSCVHALGVANYKPACQELIRLLGRRDFRRDAHRALQRVSGQRLGDGQALWLRWWNTQPESGLDGQDPFELPLADNE